jgi:DDE superfamily endonuclease
LPNGKDIVDVVAGEPGPKSDINLFRETTKGFDSRQKFQGDKAYNGEESIKTPKKKPIKRELTLLEKERNKELASERIFVEHLICLVKIFRVAQERFRLNAHKYEQIIMTICGLVRLRIGTFIF